MNRTRAEEHDELSVQYLAAGFTPDQASLLADKILDRRKPWRHEIILAAALAIGISTIGWVIFGATIGDIQDSRRDAIVQACQETNARHDNTIEQLYALSGQAILAHPKRIERTLRGLSGSELLIDALVPVYDCQARADELTQ